MVDQDCVTGMQVNISTSSLFVMHQRTNTLLEVNTLAELERYLKTLFDTPDDGGCLD